MVVRAGACLALLLALAACGGEAAAPPAAQDEVAEALAWLEGERDAREIERWLDHPALPELLAMDEEALQERLTHTVRAGLREGDLPTARAGLRGLERDFEGRGREGDRLLSADAMRDAVRRAALDEARRAMAGSVPDRARAETALAAARDLARLLPPLDRQAGVERWVRVKDLLDPALGLAIRHEGGRVVVWTDDALLAEPPFVGALKRWAEAGAAGDLRVEVVPILRGVRRVGIRRYPADEAEERASIAARVHGSKVVVAAAAVAPGWALGQLGVGAEEGAILVATRDGRIVARLAGRLDDLSGLEPWVQKVASR